MVRYFGEPEPVYVGEGKNARTKVNMWGGVVKAEDDKPGMEAMNPASLSNPGQKWGWVQGFGATSEKQGIPFGIGEESNTGFGPGGVANPDFCSHKSLLRGKELPKSKIPDMVAPTADSEFLKSGNMPRV